jgi:hypothetical protein
MEERRYINEDPRQKNNCGNPCRGESSGFRDNRRGRGKRFRFHREIEPAILPDANATGLACWFQLQCSEWEMELLRGNRSAERIHLCLESVVKQGARAGAGRANLIGAHAQRAAHVGTVQIRVLQICSGQNRSGQLSAVKIRAAKIRFDLDGVSE